MFIPVAEIFTYLEQNHDSKDETTMITEWYIKPGLVVQKASLLIPGLTQIFKSNFSTA